MLARGPGFCRQAPTALVLTCWGYVAGAACLAAATAVARVLGVVGSLALPPAALNAMVYCVLISSIMNYSIRSYV